VQKIRIVEGKHVSPFLRTSLLEPKRVATIAATTSMATTSLVTVAAMVMVSGT
jgi:hypothetical protein